MSAPPPTVTALRPLGRGRVDIELDGVRWRAVSVEAVHRAGLSVGVTLERRRARELRRELRRQESLAVAVRALRVRDHTTASLEARLEQRGIAVAQRASTLETLARAGVVDDERFANTRAAGLATRGCGDLLIAADLELRGIPSSLICEAIAGIEAESARAERLVDARGLTAKTLRTLAAKGFSEGSLEVFVAQVESGAIG